MTDNPRIEDLRRRVQKDPASIAFAQLAEEYRRAGMHQESIEACRAGLERHPGYLSARVTLGRALIETGSLDEAQRELALVLKSAPDNLAAIRGLGEIYHKQGALEDALAQYKAALAIARNDPDLDQTVEDLTRQLKPQQRQEPENALSFAQMQDELWLNVPPPLPRSPFGQDSEDDNIAPLTAVPSTAAPSTAAPSTAAPSTAAFAAEPPLAAISMLQPAEPWRSVALMSPPAELRGSAALMSPPAPALIAAPVSLPTAPAFTAPPASPETGSALDVGIRRQWPASSTVGPVRSETDDRAVRTIASLEQWLAAIHVARAHERT